MKTKSKAEKIRAAIKAGHSIKDIQTKFKVPLQSIYTVRWQLKKAQNKKEPIKKVLIRKSEADVAKKLGVPFKAYVEEKIKLENAKPTTEYPIEMETYMDDLAEIRRQISNLHTIEAFLQIRVDQMRQNTKWQTNK